MQDIIARHLRKTLKKEKLSGLLGDTLVRHSWGTLQSKTLLGGTRQTVSGVPLDGKTIETKVWRHSCKTVLEDTFGDTLVRHSCKAFSVDTLVEGSLEVKLPTIWTDEKQSREEAERRGRLEERRVEEKE